MKRFILGMFFCMFAFLTVVNASMGHAWLALANAFMAALMMQSARLDE